MDYSTSCGNRGQKGVSQLGVLHLLRPKVDMTWQELDWASHFYFLIHKPHSVSSHLEAMPRLVEPPNFSVLVKAVIHPFVSQYICVQYIQHFTCGWMCVDIRVCVVQMTVNLHGWLTRFCRYNS